MNSFPIGCSASKYRPDGAERFVSQALEALDNQAVELNAITRSWIGASTTSVAYSYYQPNEMGAN